MFSPFCLMSSGAAFTSSVYSLSNPPFLVPWQYYPACQIWYWQVIRLEIDQSNQNCLLQDISFVLHQQWHNSRRFVHHLSYIFRVEMDISKLGALFPNPVKAQAASSSHSQETMAQVMIKIPASMKKLIKLKSLWKCFCRIPLLINAETLSNIQYFFCMRFPKLAFCDWCWIESWY